MQYPGSLGSTHCRIIKQDHHVKILALDHFHKLFVTAYAACKKFMHMQVCSLLDPSSSGSRGINFMLSENISYKRYKNLLISTFLLLCAMIPKFIDHLSILTNTFYSFFIFLLCTFFISLDIITNVQKKRN